MAKNKTETVEETETETVETEPTFGVSELIEHVAAETGKQLKPVNLRNLLRKLEADGKISRDGEKRSRWTFSGADDENVQEVVAAVQAGADGSNKKTKAEVESTGEDSPAEAAPKKRRAKKAKPAPEPEVEEEDDLEVDLEDI